MPEQEPWPDDVRGRALALAVEHTAETASAETGVPAATIRSWLKLSLDAVRPYLPAELQSARSWHEARGPILEALGPVAAQTLVAYARAIEQDRGRDARDLAVSLGIMIDKAQLLAGEATSRTDARVLHASTDAAGRRAEEIAGLRAEIAELQAKQAPAVGS